MTPREHLDELLWSHTTITRAEAILRLQWYMQQMASIEIDACRGDFRRMAIEAAALLVRAAEVEK